MQESETDGLTIVYTYDSAGNRIQMAVFGAENYTTTYTYDANNRLTQEVKTGAVSNATVTLYAIWQENSDFQTPVTPTLPGSSSSYTLRSTDAAETTVTTLTCYVKTYEYDLAGNRTGFTLTKDGETVHNIVYQYDVLNRLTEVSDFGELEAAYTYDVNGNRASLTYANGTVTTYSYNKANWVTDLTNTYGDSVLSSYAYTYYTSGNQRSKTDSDGVVTTYIYDDLGRLVQEAETDGLTVDYTYDAAGNRIQMAVSGTETYTTSYIYDANNRLTQEVKTGAVSNEITVYTYDANGNLLQKSNPNGAEFYQYNGFNQLFITSSGSSSTVYAYNAQGIRTAKVTDDSATTFLLDGGDVIGEVEDGILTTTYLRGVNLIRRIGAEGMEYYLFNAHGDVVGLTDGFGAFVKSYDYDAFGNEENPSDSDTNPFRYCGEYFDKETGTYYLRARYYDPAIGRFTQQDTHWSPANMIYGDNPRKIYERQDALGLSTCTYAPKITAIMQSGNLYVYCTNSPVMYSDPTGNYSCVSADSVSDINYNEPKKMISKGASSVLVFIVCVASVYVADQIQTQQWVETKIIEGGIDTNGLNNHTVYVIFSKGTTDAFYVGRTCDFASRQYAHQEKPGAKYPSKYFEMIPVATNRSLKEARALEELLICAYIAEVSGKIGLANSIHSIAYKNWGDFAYEFWRAESLISGLLDG